MTVRLEDSSRPLQPSSLAVTAALQVLPIRELIISRAPSRLLRVNASGLVTLLLVIDGPVLCRDGRSPIPATYTKFDWECDGLFVCLYFNLKLLDPSERSFTSGTTAVRRGASSYHGVCSKRIVSTDIVNWSDVGRVIGVCGAYPALSDIPSSLFFDAVQHS